MISQEILGAHIARHNNPLGIVSYGITPPSPTPGEIGEKTSSASYQLFDLPMAAKAGGKDVEETPMHREISEGCKQRSGLSPQALPEYPPAGKTRSRRESGDTSGP
jgi:hypothetical protein